MIEIYIERAVQLSKARDRIHADPPYAAATALLSIHTAIALNDALLLKLAGKRAKNDDHMVAVRETGETLQTEKGRLDDSGVAQLRKLISAKSKVSYGDKSISFDFALLLSQASQRFEVWAYKRIQELS